MADTTKVFRATKVARAGIKLSEQGVSIIGDDRHLVNVDSRGVTIKGPISLVSDGTNIRRGGLWVGMNDFLAMIPSTMFTPIPQQIPFPPTSGLVSITRDVAFFTALLA